jgi:hypothetical protein
MIGVSPLDLRLRSPVSAQTTVRLSTSACMKAFASGPPGSFCG